MAQTYSWDVLVGVKADTTQIFKEIDKLTSGLANKKFDIGVSMAGGGIEKAELTYASFLKTLETTADKIQNVKVRYVELTDKLTGKTEFQASKAYIQMANAQGAVISKTEALKTWTGDHIEATGRAYTANLNLSKITGQLASQYDKLNKSVQSTVQQATNFIAKSENMSGKQVESARTVALAIQKQGEAFNKAFADKNVAGMKKASDNLDKLKPKFLELEAATKRGANAISNWADSMSRAIKNTIAYSLSLGALRVAQRELREGIQYVIDLNTEMVKIQVLQAEGAQTDEQIKNLASSYNTLAKSLGATTLEIARGSVEWLRQGKSIEETTELLKASTIMSKLGNLEAAQSTEFLTSILNGYKMSAERAVEVVDKLVAVDNKAATSTAELATALRYVSAVAGDVGVTFEQLVSYVGTISSVTRLNAEQIGQAMKTMLTRMQDIRAGKIDEEGLGINNVAIALERVNIELMSSETEFRDFGTVLEELAGKWDTLNEVEQANISKAIAGVRQANMFRVLMGNMSQAWELQTIQANAAGLAYDRYQIYLESVEAAQNRLKASVEGLWQDAIDGGLVRSVINAGIAIIDFIDKIGGLKTVFTAVIGVLAIVAGKQIYLTAKKIADVFATITLIKTETKLAETRRLQASANLKVTMTERGYTNAKIAGTKAALAQAAASGKSKAAMEIAAASTGKFSGAMGALGISMSTLPIIGIIAGIVAIGTAIYLAATRADRLKEKFNEVSQSAVESSDAFGMIADKAKSVKELADEFEELSKKQNKTTEDAQKLTEVQSGLEALIPLLKTENLTLAEKQTIINNTIIALEEELRLKKEIALLDAEKAADTAVKGLEAESKQLERQKKAYQEWIDLLEEEKKIKESGVTSKTDFDRLNVIQSAIQQFKLFNGDIKDLEKKILESQSSLLDYESTIISAFSSMGTEARQAFFEELIERGDTETQNLIYEWMLNAAEAAKRAISDSNLNTDANAALEASYEGLIGKIDALSAAMADQNSQGLISVDKAMALMDANSSLAQYLAATGNAYYFNRDAAIQASQAEVVSALNKYQLGNAAEYASQGNYALAISAVRAAIAMSKETGSALQLLMALSKLAGGVPSVGGGGGGSSAASSQNDAQRKALEARIKAHEKEKDALKDKLDEFKKWIQAQKDALKAEKEANDYRKKMADMEKDLVKTQTEMAYLSLDDSEEAQAQMLELQEQAAEQQEEITEEVEDRKYDLQIEALDRVQDAYEDSINAQIDAIDGEIEKLRELISTLTGTTGGGGGGAIGSVLSAFDILKLQALETFAVISEKISASKDLTDAQKASINEVISRMLAEGATADQLKKKYEDLIKMYLKLNLINAGAASSGTSGTGGTGQIGNNTQNVEQAFHSGGVVEKHHDGSFAGNLESNEVFAKLLKGEYVATEGEMNNFFNSVLPRLMGAGNVARATSSNVSEGNVSIGDFNITVEGNLDEEAAKKLKADIFGYLNTALRQKGKKPDAFNYSV